MLLEMYTLYSGWFNAVLRNFYVFISKNVQLKNIK